MTWKDYLKDDEKLELKTAREARDVAQAELTAIRRKLQSRCESRMRQAKANKKGDRDE